MLLHYGPLNCCRVSMALIADVQRALMEGGTKTIVTRSLRKLVRPAVKIGTLVFSECDLREPMPERQVIPGITVREATLNDAHLFEDPESFFGRIREGSRCFIGVEDATGKLTNYRWINTSAAYVPELKRYMVFRPNEAYAFADAVSIATPATTPTTICASTGIPSCMPTSTEIIT
jgi:hypothetical protein